MRKLISLDVFDTAIFRKVFYPTDIFNLVENEVGHDFKNERIKAQRVASRINAHCNIIDIYKQFPFKFNPKVEIQAEYKNCKANPYILEMYNKENADFIFISDMYLPANVIKSMLEKCGYKDPKVFVSCDLQAFKGDGKLFLKVQEVLKRKIDKHIGDNYNADILGAKKARISEVEYVVPPVYQRQVVTPALEDVKLRKLLIDKELSNASIEEKIGYQFAPLALSFTKKVLDEINEDQTIFFNARDGFLLYIIARWILKTKKKIKYCRFSRKSCHLPNINTNYRIDHQVNERAMYFFKTLRINTIKELINTCGFSGNYSRIFKNLGIEENSQLDYYSQRNQIIHKFLVAVQDELYEKARYSRRNFKVYVDKLGMKNNDVFIDLGHAGSMQNIIKSIMNINLDGKYVHLFGNVKYFGSDKGKKSSFLPLNFMGPYTGIVEVIFSEPTGTSVAYSEDGKVILSRDVKYRKEVTNHIIRGVLKGVKDIINENIYPPYEDVLKVLNRFLNFPTLEEAQFGNTNIFENGSYDNNESVVWFNRKLIKEGKIKECYGRSYWKPAFKLLLLNDSELKFLVKEIQ